MSSIRWSALFLSLAAPLACAPHYDVGDADGIPGPKTRAGVEAFQRDYGLVVDGIYGPRTRGAIEQALKTAA